MRLTLFPQPPDPNIAMRYVEVWERWLDSLASEGGHIVLWSCGVLFGVFCYELGYDILGDRICASAITGLGISLKTVNSNYRRRSGSETTTVATQIPAAPSPVEVIETGEGK